MLFFLLGYDHVFSQSNASNHPAPQCKNQHPAWVFTSLFSPRLCILRGVNSRGVGVGGSTVVHGYRMCLDGKAVWLPSVRVARCSPTFSLLSSDPLFSFDALSHFISSFVFCLSCIYRCSTNMLIVHLRQKCLEICDLGEQTLRASSRVLF